MPSKPTVGLVGGTIIAAAIGGTVLLNRTRPSQPPVEPVTVTQNIHPYRPNVCTDYDVSAATRWSQAKGYEWLATRCDVVHDWITHAPSTDPAVWLAMNGYDSPDTSRVVCDNTVTLDFSALTPQQRGELAKAPYVFITYHGRVFNLKFNPMMNRQTIPVTFPCYADRGQGATFSGWGNMGIATTTVEVK